MTILLRRSEVEPEELSSLCIVIFWTALIFDALPRSDVLTDYL